MNARINRETKLVVVIDDDRLVLEATAGLLQSWGCRVVTAVSYPTEIHQPEARSGNVGSNPP